MVPSKKFRSYIGLKLQELLPPYNWRYHLFCWNQPKKEQKCNLNDRKNNSNLQSQKNSFNGNDPKSILKIQKELLFR